MEVIFSSWVLYRSTNLHHYMQSKTNLPACYTSDKQLNRNLINYLKIIQVCIAVYSLNYRLLYSSYRNDGFFNSPRIEGLIYSINTLKISIHFTSMLINLIDL